MLRNALLVASLFLLAGCAAIMNGSSQSIELLSSPASAKVFIDGVEAGTTPVLVQLSRKKRSHSIRIELDGYVPFNTTLTRQLSAGWFFLDILLFGPVGLAVDVYTGAMYKLDRQEVSA